MKAMIFAAGLGTRLKPLTDHMPKALVEVAGKPLLQHQLEKLRSIGVTRVVINVHHFADMIEEWVREHPMGVDVLFSDEREALLETGGGIRKARPLLGEGRVLIHNCDILSNADLKSFYEKGEGAAATLLLSERKTSRYLLFDNGMNLQGWTNISTGEVKYVSHPDGVKDISQLRPLAFSGIHQIDSSAFPLMDEWPEKFPIIDFYLSLASKMTVRGVLDNNLQLMDVGKQETLAEAESFVSALAARG